MKNKQISVVIVSNRQAKLRECITNFGKQTYSNFAIIVVWNGTLTELRTLQTSTKHYKNITFIRDGSNNVSRGRNIGIKHAKSDYVAFTDDDCIVDKKWLDELYTPFRRDQKLGGTGSIRTIKNNDNFFANLWQITNITIGDMDDKYAFFNNKNIYLCTSSVLFPKKVLNEVGGFDESLTSGEDSDISVRIKSKGYNLTLVPKAIVQHYHPETISHMIKQQLWYGRGDYVLYHKHKWANGFDTFLRIAKSLIASPITAVIYAIKQKNIKLLVIFPIYVLLMDSARTYGYIKTYINMR